MKPLIDEYNLRGFVKIPGVFADIDFDFARKMAYTQAKDPKFQGYLQKTPTGYPSLLFWPQHYCHTFAKLSDDPRLKEIVRTFLGPDVFQLNNQIYFRESGDSDSFAWHQDICFRTPPEDFEQIETSYLQTVIAIDEVTEDNGAVEFLPGSHLFGDMNLIPRDNTERGLRAFERRHWNGVKVTANPGDVILWSVMTVHGSEVNKSGKNRMTYMNGFAKMSAVKNKKKFPIYMQGEKQND